MPSLKKDRLFISSDNSHGTHLLMPNSGEDSLWVKEVPLNLLYYINKDLEIFDSEKVTRKDLDRIRFWVKTPDQLLNELCDILSTDRASVESPVRQGSLVRVRAYFCVIGRELGFYVIDLGKSIKRDYSTVLFHTKKHMGYLDETKPWYSKETEEEIHGIKLELKARMLEAY